MKKKLLSLLVIAGLAISLAACGGADSPAPKPSNNNSAQKEEEEKVYVSESEILSVFSDPEKYKGKYIKLTGQVFYGPDTQDGLSAYQAYNDFENFERDFVFATNDSSLKQDEYVQIDGKILGAFEGENIMGGTIVCPMISSDTVTKLSFIDAVVPTLNTIIPENAVIKQHDVELKIDKIEFAEKETRVYFTETNNSDETFSLYVHSMLAVQNGKQLEQDDSYSYQGEYPELASDLLSGASSSGIVTFPAMDSSSDFKIVAEGSSDDYDLDFKDFVFEIKAQ